MINSYGGEVRKLTRRRQGAATKGNQPAAYGPLPSSDRPPPPRFWSDNASDL